MGRKPSWVQTQYSHAVSMSRLPWLGPRCVHFPGLPHSPPCCACITAPPPPGPPVRAFPLVPPPRPPVHASLLPLPPGSPDPPCISLGPCYAAITQTHIPGGVPLGSPQQHHPHHLAVAHLRCDPQWCRPVLQERTTRRPHSSHTVAMWLPHGIHTAATQRPHGSHMVSTQHPHSSHVASTRQPHDVHTAGTPRPHGSHMHHVFTNRAGRWWNQLCLRHQRGCSGTSRLAKQQREETPPSMPGDRLTPENEVALERRARGGPRTAYPEAVKITWPKEAAVR